MPSTVCDLTTVRGRLIAALNAAEAGAWSTSVPATASGDKRRNDTELDKIILAADARVCRTLCGALESDYRQQFLTDSDEIEHGGLILPAHIGPPEQVRVKPTEDGTYIAGAYDESVSFGDIDRWRENEDGAYGNTPADPFYIIDGRQIFFVGYRAQMKVAVFIKSNACQAPIDLEDLVLAVAYITAPKEGDKGRFLPLFQSYATAGLEEIKSGTLALPRLEMMQEAAR